MGCRRKRALRVQFDGKLRLEFHRAKISSSAGWLPFRELDGAFHLTEPESTVWSASRHSKNTQPTPLAMLRQANYRRWAGHEDVNDAESHFKPGPAKQPPVPRGCSASLVQTKATLHNQPARRPLAAWPGVFPGGG
jgi:hypothetical protein